MVRRAQKRVLDMRMRLILFQGTETTASVTKETARDFCYAMGHGAVLGTGTGKCALVFGNGGVGSWMLRNHEKGSWTSISDKNSCVYH